MPSNDNTKHKERLRQRYIQGGLQGFHDYEVLELMLSFGQVRQDTKAIAKRLIARFGSLTGVITAPVQRLMEVEAVGERTAVLLKLFRDTGEYYMRERIIGEDVLDSAEKVYEYLMRCAKGRMYEEFRVIYLNSQNVLLDIETLTRGTVNEAKVYLRQICERALQNHAVQVIVSHNHPGGSLKPSQGDISLTMRLIASLELVDVKLLDHIIVTGEGYFSFASEKLL